MVQMNQEADKLIAALNLSAKHVLRDAQGQELLHNTQASIKKLVARMRNENGGCCCLGSCMGCCDCLWLQCCCCSCNMCWGPFGACCGGSAFLGNKKVQSLALELQAKFENVDSSFSLKSSQHGEMSLVGEAGGQVQTSVDNVVVESQFGNNAGLMVSHNGVAMHTGLVTGAPGFLTGEAPPPHQMV